MKKTVLVALLGVSVLTGCGSSGTSVSSSQAYAPHCFLFRQRHLLILHKYYELKFYDRGSFYNYLATHRGLQYRRVSCYRNYGYGYVRGYGYNGGARGGSKLAVVKNLYQRYKAHRASRSGQGSGFHIFSHGSSGRHR
ncbi:MAG: hypothetical protein NVSMB22_05970 [Chloroflexota bacterium]